MRASVAVAVAAAAVCASPAFAGPVATPLDLQASVSVTSAVKVKKPATVHVEWHDSNVGDYTVEVRFGDGDGSGQGRYVECIVPVAAREGGQSFDLTHAYKHVGTYTVTLTVSTRECWTSLTGLGNETVTKTARVKVG
jgi:hypothetical protein